MGYDIASLFHEPRRNLAKCYLNHPLETRCKVIFSKCCSSTSSISSTRSRFCETLTRRIEDSPKAPEGRHVLGELFCEDNGRPAKPVRLMVGLQYLKYTYDLSDEGVLAGWVENPYWQHFCGGQFFEHRLPVESSSLTVWRKRLSEVGVEEMLAETIRTGLRQKLIRKSEVERVNVDTTVQEKAIRFPTDARLLDRMRERLVRQARAEGVELRQSYCRVGKRALRKQSGYARARQFKRAARQTRKLKTILGRVLRVAMRSIAYTTKAAPLSRFTHHKAFIGIWNIAHAIFV